MNEELIIYLFSCLFIFFFAYNSYTHPSSMYGLKFVPQSTKNLTTRSRFILFFCIYIFFLLIFHFSFTILLGISNLEVFFKSVLGLDQFKGIPVPITAALIMTTVLPTFPIIKKYHEELLSKCWDYGLIPTQALKLSEKLEASDFKIPERWISDLKNHADSKGIGRKVFDNIQKETRKYEWARLSCIIRQIEHWKTKKGYYRFIESHYLGVEDILKHYEVITGMFVRFNEHFEKLKVSPDEGDSLKVLNEMDSQLKVAQRNLWKKLCQFISIAVLTACNVEDDRVLDLNEFGFIDIDSTQEQGGTIALKPIILILVSIFAMSTVINQAHFIIIGKTSPFLNHKMFEDKKNKNTEIEKKDTELKVSEKVHQLLNALKNPKSEEQTKIREKLNSIRPVEQNPKSIIINYDKEKEFTLEQFSIVLVGLNKVMEENIFNFKGDPKKEYRELIRHNRNHLAIVYPSIKEMPTNVPYGKISFKIAGQMTLMYIIAILLSLRFLSHKRPVCIEEDWDKTLAASLFAALFSVTGAYLTILIFQGVSYYFSSDPMTLPGFMDLDVNKKYWPYLIQVFLLAIMIYYRCDKYLVIKKKGLLKVRAQDALWSGLIVGIGGMICCFFLYTPSSTSPDDVFRFRFASASAGTMGFMFWFFLKAFIIGAVAGFFVPTFHRKGRQNAPNLIFKNNLRTQAEDLMLEMSNFKYEEIIEVIDLSFDYIAKADGTVGEKELNVRIEFYDYLIRKNIILPASPDGKVSFDTFKAFDEDHRIELDDKKALLSKVSECITLKKIMVIFCIAIASADGFICAKEKDAIQSFAIHLKLRTNIDVLIRRATRS